MCGASTSYVVGDTARDSLTSASCKLSDGTYINYHSFTSDVQANLRISLSSPSNPAILQIIDTRGAVLVNSLATALAVNTADTTALVRVILAAGSYLIAVRGANGGRTGPYRMVAANDASPASGCTPIWVTRGITTAQQLLNSDCTQGPNGTKFIYHVYDIVLLNLDAALFTEHSNAFTPGLLVVGSTSSARSSADSTGTNALIDFVANQQDLYRLWVGSTDSLKLGAYTLTIQ
jgi:hypothetical protein